MENNQVIPIHSEEEFVEHLLSIYEVSSENQPSGDLVLENLEVHYEFALPPNDEGNYYNFSQRAGPDQINLMMLKGHHLPLIIRNCTFNQGFSLGSKVKSHIEIEHCKFKGKVRLSNRRFDGKLKVRHSHFKQVDFYNTTFSDLADFYKCEFYEQVIFLKTDFMKISVFAACVFHKNTLFTYTLIEKLLIFRGTRFLQWLDLSLSIGDGKFNLFDMNPEGFKKTNIDDHPLVIYDQDEYDKGVTKDGIIPLKNKRETLRILKQTLVSQGNISESLFFKSLEKETLWQELKTKEKRKSNDYFDWLILFLNRCSNNHGISYWRAICFIILVGGAFFYLSAIFSNEFHFSFSLSCETLVTGGKYFIQFLAPTHSYDYMSNGNGEKLSFSFYFFDFWGRVFVGYGIYQFIQAFRKFR